MPLPDLPDGWWAPYLDIPFVHCGRTREGIDCWGLVRLPLVEIAGVDLPSLSYEDPKSEPKAALAQGHALADEVIASGVFSRVEKPQPLDVALFARRSQLVHVALFVSCSKLLSNIDRRRSRTRRLSDLALPVPTSILRHRELF